MKSQDKAKADFDGLSRAELMDELVKLRQRVEELETSESQHEQTEEALRHSKEELRAIFDGARDGIIVLDKTGKVVRVNKYVQEVGGYSENELVGKRIDVLKMVPSQSMAKILAAFVRLEKGQDVPPYEIEVYIKDGEKRISEVHSSLVKQRGEVVGIVGVMRDITERKQTERELRSSRERLEILFEFAPDAYYLTDLKGFFVNGNRAAEELTGYKRGELIGQSFLEMKLLLPEQVPKAAALLCNNTFGKPTGPDEFTLIRKDGRLVTAEMRTFPVEIEGRTLVLGIARDITGRKQAEQVLKQSIEKLQSAMEGTVHALASTTERRDPYTAGHQQRVSQLACAIAQEMSLPEEQIEGIRVAGSLHDIGKMYVPAEILSRPGPITDIELNLIKIHPQVGQDILQAVEFPWPVAQIVVQHQERLDGSGYPNGLKGEEIMLEAKILAVADVVEAMSSHRPYRPTRGTEKALEEILLNKGVLYETEVVDACLKLFTEQRFRFREGRWIGPST